MSAAITRQALGDDGAQATTGVGDEGEFVFEQGHEQSSGKGAKGMGLK